MGPMTGLTDYNRAAFFVKAKELKKKGYEAIHTADLPDGWDYERYMAESFKRLKTCDKYIKLDGWEQSEGVKREIEVADRYGIKELEIGG